MLPEDHPGIDEPSDRIVVPDSTALPQPTRLLSAKTIADLLNCSEGLIKKLIADGRLPAWRLYTSQRSLVRVRVADYEAFLERELRPYADENGVVAID